ncbi:MAG: SOS response-associated peptidase [Oscillospiraceae bacterium]|jgi:putative SOS response-associated peptidase YedK|nr:SOS response-associated peptidase [Oscillospiraceae bacterium]
MCGRYNALTEDEIIEVRAIIKKISLKLAKDEFKNYNETQKEVAPTNYTPVVTVNGDELAFENGIFGFEKWDGKGVIINARAETVHEKQMFRKYTDKNRCVVPASGYYEWKSPADEQRGKEEQSGKFLPQEQTSQTDQIEQSKKFPPQRQKKKVKHLIKDKNGNLLFMAGLWRDGKKGKEFVIITKEPVGDVANIHDRMPVILETDKLEAWLSGAMPIIALATLDHECTAAPQETEPTKQLSLF